MLFHGNYDCEIVLSSEDECESVGSEFENEDVFSQRGFVLGDNLLTYGGLEIINVRTVKDWKEDDKIETKITNTEDSEVFNLNIKNESSFMLRSTIYDECVSDLEDEDVSDSEDEEYIENIKSKESTTIDKEVTEYDHGFGGNIDYELPTVGRYQTGPLSTLGNTDEMSIEKISQKCLEERHRRIKNKEISVTNNVSIQEDGQQRKASSTDEGTSTGENSVTVSSSIPPIIHPKEALSNLSVDVLTEYINSDKPLNEIVNKSKNRPLCKLKKQKKSRNQNIKNGLNTQPKTKNVKKSEMKIDSTFNSHNNLKSTHDGQTSFENKSQLPKNELSNINKAGDDPPISLQESSNDIYDQFKSLVNCGHVDNNHPISVTRLLKDDEKRLSQNHISNTDSNGNIPSFLNFNFSKQSVFSDKESLDLSNKCNLKLTNQSILSKNGIDKSNLSLQSDINKTDQSNSQKINQSNLFIKCDINKTDKSKLPKNNIFKSNLFIKSDKNKNDESESPKNSVDESNLFIKRDTIKMDQSKSMYNKIDQLNLVVQLEQSKSSNVIDDTKLLDKSNVVQNGKKLSLNNSVLCIENKSLTLNVDGLILDNVPKLSDTFDVSNNDPGICKPTMVASHEGIMPTEIKDLIKNSFHKISHYNFISKDDVFTDPKTFDDFILGNRKIEPKIGNPQFKDISVVNHMEESQNNSYEYNDTKDSTASSVDSGFHETLSSTENQEIQHISVNTSNTCYSSPEKLVDDESSSTVIYNSSALCAQDTVHDSNEGGIPHFIHHDLQQIPSKSTHQSLPQVSGHMISNPFKMDYLSPDSCVITSQDLSDFLHFRWLKFCEMYTLYNLT